MLGFIFFGLVIMALVLEMFSLKDPLKHIRVTYGMDMEMAEPDEKVTVSYEVMNTGKLPVFYLGLSFSFDDGVKIIGGKDNGESRIVRSFTGISMDRSLFLMPHSRISGKFGISLPKRGIYRLGRCYLEAGDLLGLKSSVTSVEGSKTIICTASLSETNPDVTVLGGYIGDISVRRFIMEDPSMLAGYNDYTGVEPVRKISWIQSAKAAKLMVRKNDYTLDTDVAVAVNLERTYASSADLESCMELTRTACEKLEEMKIPYSFLSNGDLRDIRQGFGRNHLSAILRTIGLSSLVCYSGLDSLIDKCIAENHSNRSYILITPYLDKNGEASLQRLRNVSDHEVCVIYGGRNRMKEEA